MFQRVFVGCICIYYTDAIKSLPCVAGRYLLHRRGLQYPFLKILIGLFLCEAGGA